MADFRNLTDLYARRYAGLEWKLKLLKFDALDLAPWIARVNSAASDLDFYDLMVEYVSDLQDAHDQYFLPSDFEAYLGFGVDIYDGKLTIDSIDRSSLPAAQYPFQIGDQLVSVDGKSSADLMKLFSKYVSGGNPRTVERLAAELITDRYQFAYPYAPQVGDSAEVVVLRQDGNTETYTIPWQKSGTPLTVLGRSAGPRTNAAKERAVPGRQGIPYYQQFLQQIRNYALPGEINVVGFGALKPVFQLPNSFVQRLGKHSYDSYYSGTFLAEDGLHHIGYLRIPDFDYPSMSDLDKEIRYFQANTDALVVDIMRNPGGSVCNAEAVLSRLAKMPFQGASAERRVDWMDIVGVNQAMAEAEYEGADDDTMAQLKLYQTEYHDAFLNNAGRTRALPLCGGGVMREPAANAYSKPVLVLVDEMSASAADIFAAMAQDNSIAPLFGYRTMGAGGSPEDDYAGVYSEGDATVTRSLVVRPQMIATADYPSTQYIENVGVRPETVLDYMTFENLVNHGSSFVSAFSAKILAPLNGM
jgi:hypothetical protein